MRILILSLLVVAGLFARSCGRKPSLERDHEDRHETESASAQERETHEDEEDENAPDSGDIGEDAIAFLRSTKLTPAPVDNSNCPQCAADKHAAEVFQFGNVTIDRVTPADDSCEVDVRLYVTYAPSSGGVIAGGLTGWIPAQERAAYERGETPSGQRVYAVRISYRRKANGWQPIEFTPGAP